MFWYFLPTPQQKTDFSGKEAFNRWHRPCFSKVGTPFA
jgi:hypothetical protein